MLPKIDKRLLAKHLLDSSLYRSVDYTLHYVSDTQNRILYLAYTYRLFISVIDTQIIVSKTTERICEKENVFVYTECCLRDGCVADRNKKKVVSFEMMRYFNTVITNNT